jgi:hypothetical protein
METSEARDAAGYIIFPESSQNAMREAVFG